MAEAGASSGAGGQSAPVAAVWPRYRPIVARGLVGGPGGAGAPSPGLLLAQLPRLPGLEGCSVPPRPLQWHLGLDTSNLDRGRRVKDNYAGGQVMD